MIIKSEIEKALPGQAARLWEGKDGRWGSSRYDRPAARLLLAMPIAWLLADASGGPSAGLRRALAEQMANSAALCAIL